jgi:ATP-dependent DNA helicase RecG
MEAIELLEIMARGEDSKHQFKANFSNVNDLAAEMVAFSNSGGGYIFIGINNAGAPAGLTRSDMERLNQLVSNAASQSVRPPINPSTENIQLDGGLVMVVIVYDGIRKPYMDNNGAIWVKSGADKRKVTAQEEMQRMFQSAGLIHGDEVPANGLTIADVDLEYFRRFYIREYGKSLEEEGVSLPQRLRTMNLAKDDNLNVAGALLFAKQPQFRLPVFIVKAVSYPGDVMHEKQYLDSEDLTGKLANVFQKTLGFISRNIRHVQDRQSVNSPGSSFWEIPQEEVLQELVANALVHRDYFISAPIRIFIFSDRVEIISPGHLPNNLTIENIKSGGVSNARNPILYSFAAKNILPFRGVGSGIRRALAAYPDIDFIEDKEANLFKVIIRRKTT